MPVDFGGTRPALARLAIPADGEVVRLLGLHDLGVRFLFDAFCRFEGDEIGTVFKSQGFEGRAEAVQANRNGWRTASRWASRLLNDCSSPSSELLRV